MEKKMNKDALAAFESRAQKYDNEATWISSEQFIKPLVPKPFGTKKLLDVCAGTGAIAGYAKTIGWDVTATDISEAMLKKIPTGIAVYVADVEDIPFEKSSFDVVTCRQGLQYVNIRKALKSMLQVAKSTVILGHITIFDKEDFEFWSEYYRIAKSGRKTVFVPGALNGYLDSIAVSKIETEVLTCWESLLSPIDHLDSDTKSILKKMLTNTSDEFKSRNHIIILDNDIKSERRWEIIRITK